MHGQFASLDRARRRHRRAVDAPGQGPHAGLCRQSRRLARRSANLAGPGPSLGGPALRHAAPIADAAVRRPAHERASAQLESECGPDPRRHRSGRRRDGRGPSGRQTGRRRISSPSAAPRRWRIARCEPRSSGWSRLRSRGGSANSPARTTALSRSSPAAASTGAERLRARSPAARRSRRECASSENSGPSPSASGRPGGSRRSSRRSRAGGSSRLKQLKEAIEDGRLKGLARGLAYQLVEQSGAWTAGVAETRIRTLSRNERRTLKGLGVRFGAFSLYLPSLLTPEASLSARLTPNSPVPAGGRNRSALTVLPHPAPPPEALSLRGLRAVGRLAAPIAELERLDALARAALPEGAGAVELTPALLADLKWRVRGRRARPARRWASSASAKAKARRCGAGARRRRRQSHPGLPPRRSPRSRLSPSRRMRPGGERAAGRPGAASRRGATLRDGRRLPDRRLAVARPLLQDQKPRCAHRRGRRRPARARRRADADRQAEPRGAARRCSHLRARAAMAGGQGRGAWRAARSRARGAGAV